tara:strand:+ start:138 stop:722 length:585 start_codon:yes stop_codon:yes gene_type:complete
MLKATSIGQYSLILIGLTVICFSLQAAGFTGVSLNNSMQTCAKLTDDTQRLFCFDKLVKPVVGLVEKKEIGVVASPVTALTAVIAKKNEIENKPSQTKRTVEQENNFAKNHIKKTSEEEAQSINSIELRISKLKKLIRGEWKISFENGQKWQQKDSDRIKLKVGDKVILEKGASTAIYLKKIGTKKRIRVKRVK